MIKKDNKIDSELEEFLNFYFRNKEIQHVEFYSIADGLAGILVLLAQYYISEDDLIKKKELEKRAWFYLNTINESSIEVSQSNRGLWTGPLGISTAIDFWTQVSIDQDFATKWNEFNNLYYKNISPMLYRWANLNLNDLRSKFNKDIIFGLPGVLNYVCNCTIAYKNEQQQRMFTPLVTKLFKLDLISRYGKNDDELNPRDIGMAHGLAGAIFSILQYDYLFNGTSYISQLSLWSNYFSRYVKFLLTLKNKEEYLFIKNWCTGLSGIINLLRIMGNVDGYSEIQNYVNYESSSINGYDNLCLCHGDGSILLIDYIFNNNLYCKELLNKDIFMSYKYQSCSMLSGAGGILTFKRAAKKSSPFLLSWLLGLNDFRSHNYK